MRVYLMYVWVVIVDSVYCLCLVYVYVRVVKCSNKRKRRRGSGDGANGPSDTRIRQIPLYQQKSDHAHSAYSCACLSVCFCVCVCVPLCVYLRHHIHLGTWEPVYVKQYKRPYRNSHPQPSPIGLGKSGLTSDACGRSVVSVGRLLSKNPALFLMG